MNEDKPNLSQALFGRDISGLSWNELTHEEKRAINELAQSPQLASFSGLCPEPPSALKPQARVTPAGFENRKARRARNSLLRRAAWSVFQHARHQPDGALALGERQGVKR